MTPAQVRAMPLRDIHDLMVDAKGGLSLAELRIERELRNELGR